jgi:hypothetical protein
MSQLASHLQNFFKPREVLIVGVVLLLILGSLGLFAIMQMPNSVAANVQATSTVHAKAISTAYVATDIARSAATATIQARGTATVQAIATSTAVVTDATASAIASANPYPPHNGTLVLDDTLHYNSANYWNDFSDKNSTCSFAGGVYHVKTITKNLIHRCSEFEPEFSNFVFQVQMTILSGNGGGITFRDDLQYHFYSFIIMNNGSYELYKFSNDQPTRYLLSGTSPAIKTGLRQVNLIAVIAHGKTLDFYVNNRHVTSVNDGSYSQGYMGVCVSSVNSSTEATFNNAKVWKL